MREQCKFPIPLMFRVQLCGSMMDQAEPAQSISKHALRSEGGFYALLLGCVSRCFWEWSIQKTALCESEILLRPVKKEENTKPDFSKTSPEGLQNLIIFLL